MISISFQQHSDMDEEMRELALKIITTACEIHEQNFELAAKMIKEKLDEYSGKFWHVCVGESFGYEITHDTEKLIYLFFGNIGIVVWKCA